MDDVYIISAARTPIGNFNGTLSKFKASDLGAIVIREVINRSKIKPDEVQEVIMGQALTAGQGQNPARQAAIQGGIPILVPAYCINMLCGSGLKSVALGYQSIRSGDSNIVICGGQENMTLAPHVMNFRSGIKMGDGLFIDSMVNDGLTDAMHLVHMGITAENLSKKYEISREEQDLFALKSQNLAENAQKSGHFDNEIVEVKVLDRKSTITFNKDEYLKHGTNIEGLGRLKPCFVKDGTVTPGNASGINDSASAVLLMSGNEVLKRKIKPMGKIIGWSQIGCEPELMGIGPVKAIENLLLKCGWDKNDVDLYELNEAFAAQSLAVNKCLGIDANKINISGGAIALGHPIGASGNRILVTLLYNLERTNSQKGVAALCVGGGMGIAMAIERISG